MKKNNSEKDNRIGTPKVPQILSQNEPVRETACINTNSTVADSFAGYLNQWGNKLTMPAPEHSVEADISDEELNKQIFLYYEDCDLGNPYALEGWNAPKFKTQFLPRQAGLETNKKLHPETTQQAEFHMLSRKDSTNGTGDFEFELACLNESEKVEDVAKSAAITDQEQSAAEHSIQGEIRRASKRVLHQGSENSGKKVKEEPNALMCTKSERKCGESKSEHAQLVHPTLNETNDELVASTQKSTSSASTLAYVGRLNAYLGEVARAVQRNRLQKKQKVEKDKEEKK